MTASKKRQVLKLDNQQCVIVAKILSRFISKLQDSTTLVSFFEPKLKQKKMIFRKDISIPFIRLPIEQSRISTFLTHKQYRLFFRG